MKKPVLYALIGAVALISAAIGLYFGQYQSRPNQVAPSTNTLPPLSFSTLEGEAKTPDSWPAPVKVINFWATWCPPCREEMPAFSTVQAQLGANRVQFVGIGIDTPDNIKAFQEKLNVSYPLLIGSYDALKQTAALGNPSLSLPFTLIIGPGGRIIHTHQGKLEEADLIRLLTPLLGPAH